MNDLSMVVQVRRTTRFHGYCFDFGYQLVLYERASVSADTSTYHRLF